jgi:hypothetical protein
MTSQDNVQALDFGALVREAKREVKYYWDDKEASNHGEEDDRKESFAPMWTIWSLPDDAIVNKRTSSDIVMDKDWFEKALSKADGCHEFLTADETWQRIIFG